MKVWHRLMFVLNGLIMFGLGVIFFLFVTRYAGDLYLDAHLESLGIGWLLGSTFICLVLCYFSFYAAFQQRREEETIIDQTNFGEIQIAVSAVESLALRATKRVKGVKDAHIGVRANSNGMDIYIEITSHPDISIPQISEEIRQKVAEYVTETVGSKVNSVKVLVARVAQEARSRVE